MGAQQSAAAAVIDKQAEVPAVKVVPRHEVHQDGRVRIIIEEIVYDVTDYLDQHPGGSEVLLHHQAGDATFSFVEAGHPDSVRDLMKLYQVGRLASHNESIVVPSTNNAVLASSVSADQSLDRRVKILYASQSGQSQALAEWLRGDIQRLVDEASVTLESPVAIVECISMSAIDPEDLNKEDVLIFIASTYTDGQPPEKCAFFFKWLTEAHADFRIDNKQFLHKAHFASFGCGSSLYDANFNVVAKKISHACSQLGGHRLCADGFADDSVSREAAGTADSDFSDWRDRRLLPSLRKHIMSSASSEPQPDDEEPVSDESADELDDKEEEEEEEEDDSDRVVDLEELGPSVQAAKRDAVAANLPSVPRPMLTDKLRAALTKQHYKLVGSHSGVKLCRWTKAMLRGRGSCYKNVHYGIQSYGCMEMTPSLSCANKCVFCWRHSTNPVGKEWKWEQDSPQFILEHALEEHRKMINELRGVPGVQPERFENAMKPRHCALSLVGEPIMYPQINQLLRLMHREKISTFLVTNAQFPDQMADLEPVTQLYLSIDASTKEALKAIDRPLFSDFWERFIRCMHVLRTKKQRTVFRLTLVKGSNMANIAEYVKLVEMARPTLIEIKGVTFCGTNSGANDSMTMKAVPFHEEVIDFAQSFCDHLTQAGLTDYSIACEHEHSCSMLIASHELKDDEGRWNTWIDYDKYNVLIDRYYETGETFTTRDYMALTPEWALYGAKERGFNPSEERFSKAKQTREQARQKRIATDAAEEAALAASNVTV